MTIKELERIAIDGDVELQYKLGMAYKEEMNESKALKFLVLSAENGNTNAMNELGIMYCKGEMVEQNCSAGIKWFEKAEKKGDSIACGNLGMLYIKGIGVERNFEKALEYFTKSARLGNTIAMKQVAEMYQQGIGTTPNENMAEEWSKKAQYNEEQERLKALIDEGNLLLDKNKVEEAREKYFEALEMIPVPKGSFYNATWLYAIIGDTYVMHEDYGNALNYFEEAYFSFSGNMNPYILYMIGKCYYKLGDINNASKYFQLAYEYDDKNIFEMDNNKYLELISY